jgi:hypothetical protein
MMRRFWLPAGATLVAALFFLRMWEPRVPSPPGESSPSLASSPSPSEEAAEPSADRSPESARAQLFDLLRPVKLTNCELRRYGEPNDGGYLMCANLLEAVESGYSYGISNYDKWGCDISTELEIPVHQYDCFDTRQPSCRSGQTIFHAECVGPTSSIQEGRTFDTVSAQIGKNGDLGKRLVMKMDVEAAEWESLYTASDEVLNQIDQLAIEFHGVNEQQFVSVVARLKEFFHVAHLHFNNHACDPNIQPFTAWAYEVLFVSRRLGKIDPSGTWTGGGLHPLDAPNHPGVPDCQPARTN